MCRHLLLALAIALGWCGPLLAEEKSFERVAGIFEKRCLSCHSRDQRQGGLSLAESTDALAGGESGPAIVAAKPAESLLLDYVMGDKPAMPKSGPPLAADEIEAIRAWIAAGAKWPVETKLRDRSLADANWWSLRPLVRPPVPASGDPPAAGGNPIDAFIRAKLAENGLSPSPAADRRTLIRRLYFDLLGLPPTPTAVQAFVNDPAENAYERLVDELLASPHFGERWARHWLDVVHFGETHGYDKDQPRPHAWPYRDYVIRAFNSDKPYGRFIEEQIAGDVLYPGTVDGVEALGFIAAGPWDFIGHVEVPETKIDGKVARHLDRDDMVANTIGTFGSLTVGCAQCHNHKFDPIPQADYYRLQAVFAAVDRADKPYDRDPLVARRRSELRAELARLGEARQSLDAELAKVGGAQLRIIDDRLAELAIKQRSPERPEFGYHSQISDKQDTIKWVQIDLGKSHSLARLVVVGCHDNFNSIGAGFGFPVRYKIEVSDDPQFQAGVKLALDRTADDAANPGIVPHQVELADVAGRYVRFTATKLAPRLPTDFNLALAELSVFTPEGTNVALGAAVTALDSVEAPIRWRKSNLVDGHYFGQASGIADELSRLKTQRDVLLASRFDPPLRARFDKLAADIAQAERELKSLPPQQIVYAGTAHRGSGNFRGTGGQPRPIFVLNRGNVTQPGDAVLPGALSCLDLPIAGTKSGSGPLNPLADASDPGASLLPATPLERFSATFDLPPNHAEGDRRAALARWLADPRNPLTWRSIVNRLWQHHFGRGIVDTPSDFGRMGSLPTHPELLDWLACELRDGGQSLKQLHKRMVMSATYRQTSLIPAPPTAGSDPARIDADNRYLWRANRRRLEAEAVRDAVLAISGNLDPTMGGPSFRDFVIEQPTHSPHYQYHLHDPSDPKSHRRSIYRFLVRSQPQPFMTTLDCADPSLRVDKRNESLSPLQALALLNNGFMVTMSRQVAERIAAEAGDPSEQARLLFALALSREPARDEQAALAFYIDQHGLPNACRLVLNLSEFAFVD
ncbi:MAG: DUF1553 domain-containing protein [Pirellulaceae bacterium]|nr:DUF1553 domain-containing protein [Pirellulaceae bacterium]